MDLRIVIALITGVILILASVPAGIATINPQLFESGFDITQLITNQMEGSGYERLVMGVGTEEGAPIRTSDGSFLTDQNGAMVVPTLNRNVLQSLVNRVNGRYHDIQLSDADLAYLLTENTLLDNEELTEVEEEFDVWNEAGPYFLLLVLPLCALSFRKGWLFTTFLAFVINLHLPSKTQEDFNLRRFLVVLRSISSKQAGF